MRNPHAGVGSAAVATLVIALSACGSGSGGGAAGNSSHDSPDGAVRGFVNALTNWDGSSAGLSGVADWVAPSQRKDFTSSFGLFATSAGNNFKISFKVTGFDIAGVDSKDQTHALVHVKGASNLCFSGAISGLPVNTCNSTALTQRGPKDDVPALKEAGSWYVDISDSGGSSSSSSISIGTPSSSSDVGVPSSTSTSGSPSTDTGAGGTATPLTDTTSTSSGTTS